MGTLTKFPIHTVYELADSSQSGLCPMLLPEIRDTLGTNFITHNDFETLHDVAAWTVSASVVPTTGTTGYFGIDYTDKCVSVMFGKHFNHAGNNILGDGVTAVCAMDTTYLGLVDGASAVILGTNYFDGLYEVREVGASSFKFLSDVSAYEMPSTSAVVMPKDWHGRISKNTTNDIEVPVTLSTGKIYRFTGWFKPVFDKQRYRVGILQQVGSTLSIVKQVAGQIDDGEEDFVSSWRKIEFEFEIADNTGVLAHSVRLESDLNACWDRIGIYEVEASLDSVGSELADRKAIDAIPSGVAFISTGTGVPILDHSQGLSGFYRTIVSSTTGSLDIYEDGDNVCVSGNFLSFDPGTLPHWYAVDFDDTDLDINGSVVVYHSLGCKVVHVHVAKDYANGETLKIEPDFVRYLSESFIEVNVASFVSSTTTPTKYKVVIGLPGVGTNVNGQLTYPYSGCVSSFINSQITTSGNVRELMVHHGMNITFTDKYNNESQPLDLLPVIVTDGYHQKIVPDFVNYLDNNRLTVGLTNFGKYWFPANEIIDTNDHWNVAVGNLASGVSGYFTEFSYSDLMSGSYTSDLSTFTAGEPVTGKLYVEHHLGQAPTFVTVVDDTFTRLSVNEYELRFINDSICEIDLRDYIRNNDGFRLVGKWGVLVGNVVNPVFGTGSVQGGKNQFYSRFDMTTTTTQYTSGGLPYYRYQIASSTSAAAGTVVGKVFVRCFDAVGEDGSVFSIGTLSEPERFVKRFMIPGSMTGHVSWLEYGHHHDSDKIRGLIVSEYDYMTTADDIYLFRFASPIAEIQALYPNKMLKQGDVGVSVFYDSVEWTPHYGYMFPGGANTVLRFDPIDGLAKNLESTLSDTRQASCCVKGTNANSRIIFNFGGYAATTVNPSYPLYYPNAEDAIVSNVIDSYDTRVDLAKAVVRARLSSQKFAMGLASYGVSNKCYVYGGATGSTVGKVVSTNRVETYEQTTDTVFVLGTTAYTKKHAMANYTYLGYAYFAGGVLFETPDYQNVPEFDTIDKLDMSNGVSNVLSSTLTTKRYGCVGLDGNTSFAYVVSGRYRTNVDKMTKSSDTISTMTKPTLDLASASATQDANCVYMFGGFPYYDPGLETDVIQKMVMSTGTWSVVDGTLPMALSRTNGVNL